MIAASHTPGPWSAQTMEQTDRRYIMSAGPRPHHVARRVHSAADARLIAAAPCLLAAVSGFLAAFDRDENFFGPECDAARAAIAKATGTT